MRGAPLITTGVIMAILGMLVGWQKISDTMRDTVVDVGLVSVMTDNKKDLPLLLILGGVALTGEVGLIVTGARKL